ncbi:hypothetical protein ANN_12579 [Periplaneta americana]|uniref:DUF4817 domain-containing protein n=1 Tax=Periplaneta americana TaxID=6978 RepID=A0ABQ8TJ45_PERAM|nr:hypothetical protein ANN_12579 [Periplaneta americana]
MSPGSNTESYPAFARIGLRENPGKNLNQAKGKHQRAEGSRDLERHRWNPHQTSFKVRYKRREGWKCLPSSTIPKGGNLAMDRGSEVLTHNGFCLHRTRARVSSTGCVKIQHVTTLLDSAQRISYNYRSLPSKETLRGHSDSSFRGEGYIQCCIGVRLCDMYSNQELAEIHFMYGKAGGNAALARRLYQERYPQRQCPDRKTFVQRSARVVVITEDVQNVHLLLEYRPHIDVSLTCEDDPKLQEYCVCPQNMQQFDSEGIPNQAPETNKPMILNGPTSRNREGSDQVVVITEDVQNVHLLLEYRPHIDVSLTCEHDPKLQEYCVCPQNMPQFDSEGIPNQAPETNKPMILNGPTSSNREGSDQVSVEAKQLGHLYLSIDQETFDPSTGEPYD